MKIKPIYIYAGVIVAAVIFLIIFSTGDKKNSSNPANSEMPKDEIHKGLTPGSGGVSGADVSAEVKQKMEALRQAYEKNPDDTLKTREYAEFLSAAHKPDQAIPLYENILKKGPQRTDIRFSLGLVYYNKGDFTKAEELVNSVLQYDKNNVQAEYNLGAIAASRGDNAKAKSIWQGIIKDHPNSEFAPLAKEAIKMVGQ
ncbi:MAG: tetratricopeptide repeat protein [Ignavibacteriales bacterium]